MWIVETGIRAGSISPLPISISNDIYERKISAISISVLIIFAAALFGLIILEGIENSAFFRLSLRRPDDVVSIIYDIHAEALSVSVMDISTTFTLNTVVNEVKESDRIDNLPFGPEKR